MWRTTTVTLVAAVLLALIAGAALAATITCQPGSTWTDPCQGTNDDDTMDGTPGPDQINGESGNDTLNGNDGDDFVLMGGLGTDTVNGESGNDTLNGGDGDDEVSGGPGNDTVESEPGNDTLNGDDGDDGVSGGSGNDTMDGGPGNDTSLNGNDGDDEVSGGPGNDTVAGESGKDTLNGFDGDDKIDALEPEGDTIGGEDTVSGGLGNDTIAANDGVKDHIVCGPGSRDIAYSDKGTDIVSSDCEWRRSYDTPRYCPGEGIPWTEPGQPGDWPDPVSEVRGKTIWCIDGSPRDDKKLDGTTGHSDLLDSIWADKGNDTLDGGLGPNSLQGWSGNDILKGGAGTDFLYGDSSENPIDAHGFFKGAGEDKIYGGPGGDYISAIDNRKDTISCGGGQDFVQRDKRGVKVPDTTVRSTVTDKIVNANDCETIRSQPEESLFWCRRYGHRKRH